MADEESVNERIQATTLSKERLVRIMKSARKRNQKLRARTKIRRNHFWNHEDVNPGNKLMLAQYGQSQWLETHGQYQTDLPRRIFRDLKARVTENPWIVKVTPMRDTPRGLKDAEDLAATLNSGMRLVEERIGMRFQSSMVDGQGIDAYAWLHWRRATEYFPEVPPHEYTDSVPEGEEDRFEKDDDGYREKDSSVAQRNKDDRARAGFPYTVEFPDLLDVDDVPDVAGDPAIVVRYRTIALLDYKDEIEKSDNLKIALNEAEGFEKIRVYMEREAPKSDDPSHMDFRPDSMLTVAEVWTRGEWYELASPRVISPEGIEADDWQMVKSGSHTWGMPPFVKVTADTFNHPDPVYRYEPALEGVFRVKPFHDRDVALSKALAERGLPWLILTRDKDSWGSLPEDGDEGALAPDSAHADELPAGMDVKAVTAELTQSHMALLEATRQELRDAAPDVGSAPVDADTQPWTARIALQISNVYPHMLVQMQALAMQKMMRSIARDMALPSSEDGLGGTVWAFRLGKDGKPTNDIVGVKPERITSLNVSVNISAVSAAEKITLIEHGATMLERGFITEPWFYEEYMQRERPMEDWANTLAHQLMREQVIPGKGRMKVAELFGAEFVVGLDGQIVGFGGVAADPLALANQRGVKPVQLGNTPGSPSSSAPGMSPAAQTRMPALTDSPPPGVIPQPAVPG